MRPSSLKSILIQLISSLRKVPSRVFNPPPPPRPGFCFPIIPSPVEQVKGAFDYVLLRGPCAACAVHLEPIRDSLQRNTFFWFENAFLRACHRRLEHTVALGIQNVQIWTHGTLPSSIRYLLCTYYGVCAFLISF